MPTTPEGLGPHQNEYTVFAVYAENLQPYCTTVLCARPRDACRIAQMACAYDNDPNGKYPEPREPEPGCWDQPLGDFGDYTLVGFQVVVGQVKVVL